MFLRYKVQKTVFCHFGPFLHFDSPNNPKNQTFEKIKKTTEDVVIIYLCTTNDNHMMYGSWDMEHNRQNFFSFWTFFALLHPPPPTPLQPRESKFWKNEKSIWIYNLLHKCTINNNNMIYRSWDTKCTIHNFFVILGHFFFLPP